MKIKDLNLDNRPRERLIKQGPESLSDIEILAILINTGTKNYSALDLANNLLQKYDLNELLNLDYDTLSKEYGIKASKASKIIASFELAKRAIATNKEGQVLDNPKEIYEFLTPDYIYQEEEMPILLLFDTKMRLIKKIKLSSGTISGVEVDFKTIVKILLKYNCYGFVLSHNHPSGDTLPSVADKTVTSSIYRLTKEINILLLDHLIWGKNSYFSFLENHLLDFLNID